MNKYIIEKSKGYTEILETHFRDMVDIKFTVENGELYILSASVGRRTEIANLRIVISMFCEGKIIVDDVFKKISYQHIQDFLCDDILVNADELKLLGRGYPTSKIVGCATACFSFDEAKHFIDINEKYIYCKVEISPEDVEIIESKFCHGVITARGGMTSHAAVICRGLDVPCVPGVDDFYKIKDLAYTFNNILTIDGNKGKIYGGLGRFEKNNRDLKEIKYIYELLIIVIKYNIITTGITPLVWRFWNLIVLHKKYGQRSSKRLVAKKNTKYISFIQPFKGEVKCIFEKLQPVPYSNLLVEDLFLFLVDELSAQVPLGKHYLYIRPLLNPLETMQYYNSEQENEYAGIQLTGVEFFRVNKYLDFMIDIYSIKIYFSTEFYKNKQNDMVYEPLNYLDFTNPNGEGLIINTFNVKGLAVYINDVLISLEDLPQVYHFLRRRKYHWTWYADNNISKREIVDYLKIERYRNCMKNKIYYLCGEMGLLHNGNLTVTGASLLGRRKDGRKHGD